MANTYHDQLSGPDLHENKVYPVTGTPLPSWSPTDSRYTQQTRAIATTSPLTGGGNLSADRTVAMPAATVSQSGYLSAADWTAFNRKGNRAEYVVGPTGSSGNDYTANGTADDVALRNALQSNRTVFVRNGTYNLANPINLAGKSGIKIVAESLNVVFQIPQAALANYHFGFMLLGDATATDITIDGVRFYGNYSNYVAPPTSYGGGIAPQTRWIVQNCIIEDFAYFGLWLGASCTDTKILSNRFVGPGHGEDHIGGGGASRIEIAHNLWEANIAGNAWDNTSGTHYHVHHNTNRSSSNFYIEAMQYVDVHHNTITGPGGINVQSDAGYNFPSITNSAHINIRDNRLNGGSITYGASTHPTKTCTTGGFVSITGNEIETPPTFGILVHAGGDSTTPWGSSYIVADNRVHNANSTNVASQNTGLGIMNPSGINVMEGLDVVVANNICVDDRATPQQRYGIQIGQTANQSATNQPNRVVLSGNRVSGYVTGPTNRVSPTYTTDYFEITGSNGAYQFGGNLSLANTNGKITGPTGLTIEETGDVFGAVRMSVQNRTGVNGVLIEQAGTPDLVELVFKGLSTQANLRYENRGGGYVGTPEFQIGTESDPALVVSAAGTLVRKGYFKTSGAISTPLTTKTAAYTLAATDSVILADATAAAFTVTLPTPVGIVGRQYTIKKVDSSANVVTIASASGNIDGAVTKVLSAQWQAARVVSDGSNWFVV